MLKSASEDDGVEVSGRFIAILFLGIALVFVGVVVLVFASLNSGGSGSAGIIIFIGPFPIVFGSGPNWGWLVLIGIIITVVSVVFFLGMNRRSRKLGD